MAALTPITPTNAGTLSAGAAVASTDTIARSVMGPKGALLEILNAGASPDTVTISDHGTTPAGNGLGSNKISPDPVVTNGTNKVFRIRPTQVNPATGLVTITHSLTTGVTYKLYPVG